MGLDATVYRNIKSLEAEFGPGLFQAEEGSGETSPIDGAPDYNKLDDTCVAVHHRIGNMAAVADLRREIKKHLKTGHSVILDKVLYSGTHCGDWIGREFFPRLKAELVILIRVKNPEVLCFVGQMAQLVGMAEMCGTSIVF